ncbi:hypothetical protein IFM5058_09367 [Aspergillus udagawae]|nr:hypothetical protein IFM5058_09367 [Aspergillus udagawae]
MSLRIRSLFDRRGVAEKKAAHAKAVEVMDEIYDLIEEHCSFGTHIDTELLMTLKTVCRDLDLANHGTYLDSFLPVFFEPLPPEQLPPVDLRDAETKRKYEFTKKVLSGPSRYERTAHDSAHSLSSNIMSTFSTLPREVPGDRSLSLKRLSGWLGTDFSPSIIDEEFDNFVFESLEWNPGNAFTTLTSCSTTHVMFSLILGYEPDERLLRAELTSIMAAIITRLADPEYEDHSVIPVMVISLLGKRKVRILQAHNNRGGIVIRESGFIRFNSPEEATDNMDLLMRFMASNRVGDTADPKNFFGPETPPTIPGPSAAGSSQEEFPEEIPQTMSRLSLTIARQGSVRVKNFLRSIRSRPRVISGGRDIFQPGKPESPPRDPSMPFESDPERRLFTRSDELEVQVPSTSAPKQEGGHLITRSDEHELHRAPVSRDLDPQTPEQLSYVPFL